MRTFDFHAPQTLQEALEILRDKGEGGRPLAGGTDLVVQMKEHATRFPYPSSVVSLTRIPELTGIEFSDSDGLRIGAAATMADVAASPEVREHYAAIAEGAEIVGSFQTMNMATIGGNICNAAPSADAVPPLIAHEAEAVIAGPQGRRTVLLEKFFRGPGLTILEPGDLLIEVRVRVPPVRTGSVYRRHTPRKQMDIAAVGVGIALSLRRDGAIDRARIALAAVAPTPVRATAAEALLESQQPSEDLFARAAEAAQAATSPISDVRGSAGFRRHLTKVMTQRLLREAAERAGGR